jgi:hypothetical protein
MRPLMLIVFLMAGCLQACKPQTESRAHMDEVSNRVSDSLVKLLDSCLALPSKALAGTGSPIASSTSTFAPK